MHDRDLLDALADLPTEEFAGNVYRATRQSLDPFIASTFGGRWSTPNSQAVLYTSLEWLGALAELSYHWNLQTPVPSRPIVIHTLKIRTDRTLRLLRTDLERLGIKTADGTNRTQEIGDAVAFLEFDGLIVPSARYQCDNMILFQSNIGPGYSLFNLESSELVHDWDAKLQKN